MGNCGSCGIVNVPRRQRRRSLKSLSTPHTTSLESDRTDTTGGTLGSKQPARRKSQGDVKRVPSDVMVQGKPKRSPRPPALEVPKVPVVLKSAKPVLARTPCKQQPSGGFLLPPEVRGWSAGSECGHTEVYERSSYVSTDPSCCSEADAGSPSAFSHTCTRCSSSEDCGTCTTLSSSISLASQHTFPQATKCRISLAHSQPGDYISVGCVSPTACASPASGRMELMSEDSEYDFREAYNSIYPQCAEEADDSYKMEGKMAEYERCVADMQVDAQSEGMGSLFSI
eukprot:TRINITY_DN20010_c0_g1_i1.p1 TRINITY_DN20010_c0_g1~~TRINITY_DN20010_c0_g1_i1.p1  ORF type:complete len:284 (+),score=34.05 TRINITY_DN20010_c0_g1_i1:263-1114(+)